MVGFGYGFRMGRRQVLTGLGLAVIGTLLPASRWVGDLGTGYTTPPTDPGRTTAKPACRLLTPPFQWFTDEIVIGVYAAANNNGSLLDNMGLEKVSVYYEGTRHDIKAPSFQTLTDANGNEVTYFGWWAKLSHDGRNGHGQVYFEAVPKNPEMQNRVIGPYQFSPQAKLHDYSVEVAATPAQINGSRYKTLAAALGYLKSVNAQNPLITFTEAGTYPVTSVSGGWYGGTGAAPAKGYANVTATAPVTLTVAAPAATADLSPMRFEINCLRLMGENITLDFAKGSELYNSGSDGRQNWLDGVKLTNSNGLYDLYRKTLRSSNAPWLIRGAAYVTECQFTNLWNPAYGLSLARGNSFNTCWSDAFDHCLCTIGNRVDDWDSTPYQDYIDALTVSYTGSEPGAAFERSGNTFKATWGSNTATFTVVSGLADWVAGTHYNVHNVADWLNTLDGWSATVLDDTRAGYTLTCSGYIPGTFPKQSVTSAGLKLVTTFDVHADWWQKQNGPALENVVVADNLTTNFVGQCVFWGNMTDMVVVNNVWHCKESWGFGSPAEARAQFGNVQLHCVFAHNTIANQRVWLRSDSSGGYRPDRFSLWSNNAVPSFEWFGGVPDANMTPDNNHMYSGYEMPTGAINTSQGGTMATDLVHPITGNFTPAGSLMAGARVPVVLFDLKHNKRAAFSPAGAIA